jgi:glycosyltransferase involved in cell wall biosynthesis
MGAAQGASAAPAGVSVIIPTHGRPVELDHAVASVYREAHDGPLEVIVVFDGEPVRPLPPPPHPGIIVRGLANGRTRGLAGARNSGILAATHEFVAFLDDDDEWIPGRLTAQLALFQAHTDCVMVGGSIRVVNERGTFVRRCPETITHSMLLRSRITGLHSCTFVLRTDALRSDLGLVDEELPGSFGEDYDLALRAAAIAPIRCVAQPVAQINWMGQSFFISTWQRNAEATEYLLDKHDFSGDRAGEARMRAYISYCLAASGQRREARVQARRALRLYPLEKRTPVALMLSWGITTPERLSRVAARVGRRW